MQSRKKEKRLTKPQIERGKNYCVFFARRETHKKTIDQLYKRKPKEYLGGERKEKKKKILEF